MTVYDEHTDEVGVAVDVEPSPLISLNIDKHHTCSLIQSTLFSCCQTLNTGFHPIYHYQKPIENQFTGQLQGTVCHQSVCPVCPSDSSNSQSLKATRPQCSVSAI